MVKSGLELTSGDLATIIIFTCPGDCKTENEEASFVTEKATIVLYKKWIIQWTVLVDKKLPLSTDF